MGDLKCPELEMAVGCILPRELMRTRRFKTGEDDASSFCTQGERREELIYIATSMRFCRTGNTSLSKFPAMNSEYE